MLALALAMMGAGCDEGLATSDAAPEADTGAWVGDGGLLEHDGGDPGSELDAGQQHEPDAGKPDAGPEPCTTVFYRDADGDGYGDPAATVTACLEPPGYVTRAGDCYDGNADAKPGQTATFDAHRGDGSFDYDCDGAETLQWPEWGACPDASTDPVTPGSKGWMQTCLEVVRGECVSYSELPDCGEDGQWKSNAALCGSTTGLRQKCR